MGLIDSRDPDKGIIEGRFITAVLNDQAKSLLTSAKISMMHRTKKVYKNGKSTRVPIFVKPKWNKLRATANNNTLTYHTIYGNRFADIKTRSVGETGYSRGTRKVPFGKKRKKNYPVYNRVVWRHKKFIIRTLSFGFTDEVKESFREMAKNEGLIL